MPYHVCYVVYILRIMGRSPVSAILRDALDLMTFASHHKNISQNMELRSISIYGPWTMVDFKKIWVRV